MLDNCARDLHESEKLSVVSKLSVVVKKKSQDISIPALIIAYLFEIINNGILSMSLSDASAFRPASRSVV